MSSSMRECLWEAVALALPVIVLGDSIDRMCALWQKHWAVL
jgi:hypothetical protein